MSAAANSGISRTDGLLADAARYLDHAAPRHGGRNARPLAVPVLVTSYCSTARSVRGAAAALLGVVGGVGVWFGLGQLEDSSTALGIGALVLAALALIGAVLLGLRVLRGGRILLAALRRWHAVAPEVPVRGAEVLTRGVGRLRVILAVVGVLAGVGALALAAVSGGLGAWLGYGIAAVSLLVAGVLAGIGWFGVRGLLRAAAPQPGQEAFAPAPQPGDAAQPAPAWAAPPPPTPGWPHGAGAPWQQPPDPQPQTSPWQEPAPQHNGPPLPQPAHVPVASVPGAAPNPAPLDPVQAAAPVEGWAPPPSMPDPDIADTRYAADTTVSGRSRRRVAVLLDDGRRLEVGSVTLVGRAPQPRPGETVETLAVEHQTVSKTHAAFRVASDSVHVTDRSSTNGTTVVDSSGYRRRLRPWAEEPVEIGSEVLLGSYLVRVRVAD